MMIEFFRYDAGLGRRPYHDASAREALTDIVVGVALKLEGDPAREERAKALAGVTFEARHNSIVRQAVMAVTLGDFARQHGSGGAVGVGDRQA